MTTKDRWYENAVFYAVDVEAFADGDGDGVGDFQGLTNRLDYLSSLGVDCLWLLPFYPSPNRDNGYDVTDYYGIDPRHGTFGDFVEFMRAADHHGIEVIVDLVVNHTSDQHPWFQKARSDPDSKYRDYYVWRDDPPEEPDPHRGPVFPDVEDSVWSYDEEAEAFYYHRFYHFQPDLNTANADVREEIRKIMGFWLELGVSGFRVDAATLMIDNKGGLESTELDDPHGVLRDMRSFVERRGDDAILLAEADDEPTKLARYFGGANGSGRSPPGADAQTATGGNADPVAEPDADAFGDGDEMNVLLNFLLSAYLVSALAEERAQPLREVEELLPEIPDEGQWANFLRNYDELNVGRLPTERQREVFETFAPDEDMRIFGRGIRRRLAPMLATDDGDPDRDRLELAYSLLFSLPGAPLFVYGDEIGMGDDLSLPGRNAVRTPMQWSAERNGGFSTADPEDLVRPVVSEGPFGYERVNVADQRGESDSLLGWFSRLIRVRKECPEIGTGDFELLETDDPSVFTHRMTRPGGEVVAVHNLSAEPSTATLDLGGVAVRLLGEATVEEAADGHRFELGRYGHCWGRVGEN